MILNTTTYAVGFIAIAIFAAAFRALKIVAVAEAALAKSRAVAGVLLDRTKTELEKEKAARAGAVGLFGCSLRIAARLCAAAAPSAALVAAAAATGLTSIAAVAAVLMSPWMVAAAVLASASAFIAP